ncbi:hypothetical protein GOP47_0023723 [Adiantum capillus-veneris]|uniref:Uncharacterized protein n=1 Tax=Adiantum capillus-veneris TaxID=13818 RepID=A0A9D4U573_ADICA|nr:hypothetical protein GOP47_0023723 [Adiantum capillus-veneris]
MACKEHSESSLVVEGREWFVSSGDSDGADSMDFEGGNQVVEDPINVKKEAYLEIPVSTLSTEPLVPLQGTIGLNQIERTPLNITNDPSPIEVEPSIQDSRLYAPDESPQLHRKSIDLSIVPFAQNGPLPSDRAFLSFVNSRKDDCQQLLQEMVVDGPVMCVARKIGAFLGKPNTLSILDVTILVHVRSVRLREELTVVFQTQTKNLGYNREVVGTLRFVNFNSVLLEKHCSSCKSTKVYRLRQAPYCGSCNKNTTIIMTPKLEARIATKDKKLLDVQVIGAAVDVVLALDRTFNEIYIESAFEARDTLATISRFGRFKINASGHVVAYQTETQCSECPSFIISCP